MINTLIFQKNPFLYNTYIPQILSYSVHYANVLHELYTRVFDNTHHKHICTCHATVVHDNDRTKELLFSAVAHTSRRPTEHYHNYPRNVPLGDAEKVEDK